MQPVEGAVERLRSTKDESEIELLEAAVNLADSAMEQALQSVHTGVTEIEIAKVIEACLRDLGADSVAFDTIVGTGVNGALPHHRAEKTLIRKGDPVVIDMGALFKGYRSDLTRTVLADPSRISQEKFEENLIHYTDTEQTTEMVNLAFSKEKANARKTWLKQYNREEIIEQSQKKVDWLIVDHYALDIHWERELRAMSALAP